MSLGWMNLTGPTGPLDLKPHWKYLGWNWNEDCGLGLLVLYSSRLPHKCDLLDYKSQSYGYIFQNWDLYIYYKIFGWDTTIWKSGFWGCKKKLNIEKIAFKVVQMKFLANQKLSFDVFIIGNLSSWNLIFT